MTSYLFMKGNAVTNMSEILLHQTSVPLCIYILIPYREKHMRDKIN